MVDPAVSLVIPAFNEARRLPPTLETLRRFLGARPERWEVIIVDDGSTDDSRAWLDSLAGDPIIRVIRHPENRGKGAAVRTGMLVARGRWRLFTDADLAYGVEGLVSITAALAGGADVTVGSRRIPGARVEEMPGLVRRILSWGFRRLARGLTGLGATDPQCGVKGFTAGAAERLFSVQRLDGYAFDVELLMLAQRAGLRVREVPVALLAVGGSRVRGAWDGLAMLRDLLRLRR